MAITNGASSQKNGGVMNQAIPIQQVAAFAEAYFEGNPAAIIVSNDLSA